jgi:tetratricopeptide (TPR) repeat protein
MLALAGVWCALQDARRGWRWLAAGSLAYGLALGARPSLLFGAVILLVPVARAWRMKRPVWPLLLAAAGPIVVVGLGLLLYNVLRFGNPLEFGENYQLPPAMNQHFSPRYLWFNFRISFLDPANWSGIFPFVDDITAPSQPSGYFDRTNPFGVLTNIPLVWLALAAPLAWRRRSAEDRSVLRWFLGAVALFFGMCALTICLYNAMSLRYELEFASPLLLLAVIGFLALERALAAQPVWRRAARCGWVLLLVFSVAFNLFAGVHMQAQLQCGLGTTLQQKGKVDEAITHYKKALQLAPGYAAAWLDLANALEQKGKVDEAVTQYRKALQIKPDYAEARCNLGNALLQMGKVDEAMSQFQLALQTKPGLAQVHNDLGTALLQKGGVDAAITQYETALQIQPDFAEAHKNLGIALLQKGRVDEAVAHLQKALQTKPDYAEAHFNLGNALAQTGAADEAIAHFQKALQIKPDYTDAHNNLGWVLLQHARVDEAIAHFQNALQIKPEFAEAHFNLANALLQKGEWGRAITQYQTALQIKPADPTFQSSLAWLLATSPEQSLRDGAKALALARQAETLSGGQNPVILRTLAAACAEQGDYALAAATARRALDLAVAQKNDTVAASLQKEIQLYEAGAPARLAPP